MCEHTHTRHAHLSAFVQEHGHVQLHTAVRTAVSGSMRRADVSSALCTLTQVCCTPSICMYMRHVCHMSKHMSIHVYCMSIHISVHTSRLPSIDADHSALCVVLCMHVHTLGLCLCRALSMQLLWSQRAQRQKPMYACAVRVRMCVCLCVRVCVRMCIFMHAPASMHASVHVHVHTGIPATARSACPLFNACTDPSRVGMCACVHACMRVCMRTCVRIGMGV